MRDCAKESSEEGERSRRTGGSCDELLLSFRHLYPTNVHSTLLAPCFRLGDDEMVPRRTSEQLRRREKGQLGAERRTEARDLPQTWKALMPHISRLSLMLKAKILH